MMKSAINKIPFGFTVFLCLMGMGIHALADYVTVDGKPVTQGQLRIAAESMAQLEMTSSNPQTADRFILQKTQADVEITGAVARVRLRQVFQNPYDERLETIYVFPMPENAAVDAYAFRIGEAVVKGVVKKKEQARKAYEEAKAEGRKAGLLEQERPNIFAQSLVNIPPRATVIVNIDYVHTLKIEGANYLFSFPMVIAPRYIPGQPVNRPNVGRGWANDTDQVPDASGITPHHIPPGMRAGHDIDIKVKIDAGMPIQNITGVTHALTVSKHSETTATISLKNGPVIPNKDFVVEYKVGGNHTILGVMTHRAKNDDGYFMMVIQPKHNVERSEVTPREIVFLLDTSGSMNGSPLSQLQAFSSYVLGTLNPQDRFNIVAFNSDLDALSPYSLEAAGQNILKGKEFIRRLISTGGTEMLPAIKNVLKPAAEEAPMHRYVILVTDALVGNDKRILSYINKPEYSNLRIYPVAMGPAPNDYLIERAAEIGRGFSMRITNQDNPIEIAKRFASKISYPIMTDLTIDWDHLTVKDILPNPLPDLYADRPLVIVGRYEKPGVSKAKLSGNILGNPVETQFDLNLPEAEDSHDSLPVLWARARIRQLTNDELGDVSMTTRNRITKLGLKYQIVTDYTSFIAVEHDIPKDISNGLRTQPVLLAIPEGMEHLFKNDTSAYDQHMFSKNRGTVHTAHTTGQERSSQVPVASNRPIRQSNSGSYQTSGGGSVGLVSIVLSFLLLMTRLTGIYRSRKK